MTTSLSSRLEKRFIAPMIVAFIVAALVGGWALMRARQESPRSDAPAAGASGATSESREGMQPNKKDNE